MSASGRFDSSADGHDEQQNLKKRALAVVRTPNALPLPPRGGFPWKVSRLLIPAALAVMLVLGICATTIKQPSTAQTTLSRVALSDESLHYPSRIEDEQGTPLLADCFNSTPFGFDESIWNLSTLNGPDLSWEDGEVFVLGSMMWTYSVLSSIVESGPEAIAEFNISFSGGLCYFGIGWSDRFWEPSSEWKTNLRLSQNGVFIDYWDNELYLASYSDGERVAAHVAGIDVTQWHHFRLLWSESLVRLEIDDELCSLVSHHIPRVPLHFVVTTSGHHYLVQHDQLRIDEMQLFSRARKALTDDPQITLLWPKAGSRVFPGDLIDFQVDGSDGSFVYSWDTESNSTTHSPYDIPVPNAPGMHNLTVWAKQGGGDWQTKTYSIDVHEETLTLEAPVTGTGFVIDGIVESYEKAETVSFNALFRDEAGSEVELPLCIGLTSSSLYVAVSSNLPDRWNTKLALLVDGEGNGFWNMSEGVVSHDIGISVGGPAADPGLTAVTSPSGMIVSRSLLPGLMFDTETRNGLVSVEYLVPFGPLGMSMSNGIGFGLKLSDGGHDWFFPAWFPSNSSVGLPVVHPSADVSEAPSLAWVLPVVSAVAVSVLGVRTWMKGRIPQGEELDTTAASERQLRMLVLLQSHPRLSIERLARLAGIDSESAKRTLQEIIELRLGNWQLELSGDEVIRLTRTAGKIEKEEHV